MSQRIQFSQHGGPEVLEQVDMPLSAPAAGEVRVRNHAIGLNFIDTYFRGGLYQPPSLPSGLGTEGAGVVDAVGEGVQHLQPGDRVAYATGPLGAYGEHHTLPARHLVKLPDSISFEQAAAVMLKGLTCQYLLRQTHSLQAGETVLFHAAAGGVGSIACQWARALGAQLIGVVGSAEKAERGLLVSFGNASGAVTGVNLGVLAQKGSLFVTRPTLAGYADTPERLQAMADELFEMIGSGRIQVEIGQRYPLSEAAEAQRKLAAGETTGSTILLP